ncbi:MAG TPA: M23 family metallopeptidase [Sphingomicrobium sp.]|nr:M23 family metallopeptidase [Sphingomicrobium sp.]
MSPSDAMGQARNGSTLRDVARRLFTYGGLAYALIFLGMQIAPPRIPVASAATPVADVTRILPPLPEAVPVIDEPIDSAALFEITLPYPAGGDLPGLLVTAGASEHDARRAAALMAEAFSGMVDAGSELKLALGAGESGRDRPIEKLTLLSDLGRGVIIRDGGSLKVKREAAPTRQVEVDIASGTYWSLRRAGLDARLALEATALVEKKRGDFRSVTAVTGERPDRFGSNATPQLLFLALERTDGRPLRLLKWPGMADGWIDADRFGPESAFLQPVNGRISSTFGIRSHPILRFLRPHQGVDFAARWGTPVRAAADGRVVAAEWRGGYGRQVQVNHGDGLATSYSHLSDMVAKPGSMVRRGQIVGYVGASGLATGPHLHFEIIRSGRRIDPLTARLVGAGHSVDRAAVAARLAQLKIAGT